MITDKLNHKWVALGAGGLIILLFIFILVLLIIWRSTPVTEDTTDTELPGSNDITSPQFPGDDSSDPLYPTPPPVNEDIAAERLLVDLEYIRQERFTINVNKVARTNDTPNIEHYKSLPDFPYSILQVKDINNEVIFEQRITLPTSVILDAAETFDSSIYNLNQSESRLIIPLPKDKVPASVTISSATREEINASNFTFETLPLENLENVREPQSNSNVFGVRSAHAQSSLTFKIVVINEVDAFHSLNRVAAQVSRMRSSIKPWTEFSSRVEVITINNDKPLGCQIINMNGYSYPDCPIQYASAIVNNEVPDWAAIVIVANADCNCGTVKGNFPPLTSVGTSINYAVLAHEMGHAVAKMTDEYMYQFLPFNAPSVLPGPNCFSSQRQCEIATQDFSEANCTAGCNGGVNNTWRSSSRIMHNTYSQLKFGQFQECLMGRSIAAKLGENYSCAEKSTTTPGPPPPQTIPEQDNFWGGGR